MRLIAISTIREFWTSLPKSEAPRAEKALLEWHEVVIDADWSNFNEIKATFNTADWVGNGKVVFDVGGNKYRVVCLVGFLSKRMYVLFVGTHREYDAIDVTAL